MKGSARARRTMGDTVIPRSRAGIRSRGKPTGDPVRNPGAPSAAADLFLVRAATVLARILPVDRVSIALPHDEESLALRIIVGAPAVDPDRPTRVGRGTATAIGWVAAHRVPVFRRDARLSPFWASTPHDAGLGCDAVAPMLSGARCVGVLAAGAHRPNVLTPSDLWLVEEFAAVASAALEMDGRSEGARAPGPAAAHQGPGAAATRQTAALLVEMVENSDDAIIGLDARGTVVTWNRGARRIFGLAEGEAVGRTLLDFLAPEEGPNGRMWLAALARGRSVRNVETHGLGGDGRRFPILLTATAVRGAAAGFSGAVVIKELAELRALQDKTRETERLTTILETVVSVNHEINNPLAIVMGNLQLLLRRHESGPPQSRAQTRAALSAARRIAEVIRRLSGIVEPVETEYLRGRGIPMLDIRRSRTR